MVQTQEDTRVLLSLWMVLAIQGTADHDSQFRVSEGYLLVVSRVTKVDVADVCQAFRQSQQSLHLLNCITHVSRALVLKVSSSSFRRANIS